MISIGHRLMFLGSGRPLNGPVHPAYNPYFLACFFSRNSVFLSQQISQQYFSAGLSAQPNGANVLSLMFTRSVGRQIGSPARL
jgi:hypothetical protein